MAMLCSTRPHLFSETTKCSADKQRCWLWQSLRQQDTDHHCTRTKQRHCWQTVSPVFSSTQQCSRSWSKFCLKSSSHTQSQTLNSNYNGENPAVRKIPGGSGPHRLSNNPATNVNLKMSFWGKKTRCISPFCVLISSPAKRCLCG